MTGWQDWVPHARDFRSPYVDWEVALYDRLGRLDAMTMVPVPPLLIGAERGPAEHPGVDEVFPVPTDVANPAFAADARGDLADMPLLPGDRTHSTVVVGVIDIDIGLGHRRFRMQNGQTRVLAAWQQGAAWSGDNPADLPFGEVLLERDINALMSAHGSGELSAPLDHDGFYQRLGLISHDRIEGMGALAKSAAHGTHVLGLAAGQDPEADPEAFSDNVRLLVVNLPPPSFFGEGGAFLDYYLSYGLHWIRQTHQRIVAANRAAGATGLAPPLLVNVSFGKQAGAPDPGQTGADLPAPVPAGRYGGRQAIFVPTGNDNLDRCHALIELGEASQELAWRVQPDDETSNFLEIWGLAETDPGADGGVPDGPLPFRIDLELPNGQRAGFGAPAHGTVRELGGGLGRIYCDWVMSATSGKYRLRYLVCLAPDGLDIPADPSVRGAPAGRYWLHLENTSAAATLTVRAQIQTDEATLPSARNARRAYFEDPDYRRFEDTGRSADTHTYPGAGEAALLDTGSPIRRRGTMNAYATAPGIVAVGGFVLSDGRPAPYSGAGFGADGAEFGRAAPTAAFPSDDGYAHFGLLSDGARDGSVMAMSGTSFACAAATRFVTEAVLDALRAGREPDLPKALAEGQAGSGWLGAQVDPVKAGWGRVAFRPQRPVDRM